MAAWLEAGLARKSELRAGLNREATDASQLLSSLPDVRQDALGAQHVSPLAQVQTVLSCRLEQTRNRQGSSDTSIMNVRPSTRISIAQHLGRQCNCKGACLRWKASSWDTYQVSESFHGMRVEGRARATLCLPKLHLMCENLPGFARLCLVAFGILRVSCCLCIAIAY